MPARFAAFRTGLYARMEEISFRTSMAVLAGVVAVAAIIAGVTLALSQGSAAARPLALSPAPVRHSAAPTAAPPTPAVSPSRATPTATARTPTRAPAVAVADPQPAAAYPATGEYSAPSRSFSGGSSRAAHQRIGSAVAAWWRSHLGGAGGHLGGLPSGGHGFGGFGGIGGFGGHGFGHR